MSTQAEIAVSYDVSNDFFRLWLDKRMIYTCALFEGTDDLETAQFNKLKWFHEAVKANPDKRLLDIGCGWGGTIKFFSQEMGLKDVTGITLSRAQYSQIKAESIPGLSVECVSYIDYQPKEKFDAIVSIGMFEHIATPEQARTGEHISIYRDYFRRAWEWTNPGSWFGLQSVIGFRVPRERYDIREISWLTSNIFPGAITPRLEAIVASVNPYWEVMEVKTRREHYAKTTAEWLRRLKNHEVLIRQRWGDEKFTEYERYLSVCVMAFEKSYQSLAQIVLRRID
ncbi:MULTISPECIES: class I SAM-dependent methyltransferase [unclassified Nostoc]|uniref:class I SAM-dependent methyltransferase n=1 Tax=unclassified Nostoc TaxID=2593658 RepID=UPI002AD3C531|nr:MULTISPECIES: class I SAM-dependent methyltransferase [unclassified Nostoc]MDZ8120921.1 class I SAM-dependent methyltransferase [Nostoc sp. CmiVER01]MDZ8226279.1 class I SAM-dependent methyltransferase [Nostoc sp. ChiVER01]